MHRSRQAPKAPRDRRAWWGPLLALAIILSVTPALAVDLSDTDWEVRVHSRVIVRGVGPSVLRGMDILHFQAEPDGEPPAHGPFHFDRARWTGFWRDAGGRRFVGRLDERRLRAVIEHRVNARLGTDDAEVTALHSSLVRGLVSRSRQQLRMTVRVKVRLDVPSLGIEGRAVFLKVRLRGRLVTGDPGE